MLFEPIANIIFPPICIVCRRRVKRGTLCAPCFTAINLRRSLMCSECHAPAAFRGNNASTICHPDAPYLLGAATDYSNETVQTLIHHLKFRSIKGAAEPLAELIIRYCEKICFAPAGFLVIPIPLSPRRLRTRGYNQAEIVARRVAAALELPVATGALIRAKHAKPQSETISIAERRENIRGAYAIRNDPAAGKIINETNILLIDDVATSGATFLEASRTLKAAGANNIVAIAAAKT